MMVPGMRLMILPLGTHPYGVRYRSVVASWQDKHFTGTLQVQRGAWFVLLDEGSTVVDNKGFATTLVWPVRGGEWRL
jgi:hypothetical protein